LIKIQKYLPKKIISQKVVDDQQQENLFFLHFFVTDVLGELFYKFLDGLELSINSAVCC
jgi:hypothetical protein